MARFIAAGAFDAVILDGKGDALCIGGDQALVRNGDAVVVAGKISEHRFGSAKGPLRIDHSFRAPQGLEEGFESPGVGKARMLPQEDEPPFSMGGEQPLDKSLVAQRLSRQRFSAMAHTTLILGWRERSLQSKSGCAA